MGRHFKSITGPLCRSTMRMTCSSHFQAMDLSRSLSNDSFDLLCSDRDRLILEHRVDPSTQCEIPAEIGSDYKSAATLPLQSRHHKYLVTTGRSTTEHIFILCSICFHCFFGETIYYCLLHYSTVIQRVLK